MLIMKVIRFFLSQLFSLNKLKTKRRLLGDRTMNVCTTFATRVGSVYVLRMVVVMKTMQCTSMRRDRWICKCLCPAKVSIERRGFEKQCKMGKFEVESGVQ